MKVKISYDGSIVSRCLCYQSCYIALDRVSEAISYKVIYTRAHHPGQVSGFFTNASEMYLL